LPAEGATINGGNTIDSSRRRLERPLYDAPLPLVANNWPRWTTHSRLCF